MSCSDWEASGWIQRGEPRREWSAAEWQEWYSRPTPGLNSFSGLTPAVDAGSTSDQPSMHQDSAAVNQPPVQPEPVQEPEPVQAQPVQVQIQVPELPALSEEAYSEDDLNTWAGWVSTCIRHTGTPAHGRHPATIRPDGLPVGAPMDLNVLNDCLRHWPPKKALANIVAFSPRLSWQLVNNVWHIAASRPRREAKRRRR